MPGQHKALILKFKEMHPSMYPRVCLCTCAHFHTYSSSHVELVMKFFFIPILQTEEMSHMVLIL